MWSAIAKIFTKNSGQVHSEDQNTGDMDTKPDSNNAQDSYDTRQAKQRASVKWLLSKAFNNKVPENLKEPFYRDHENQEHLKPQIIGALANAEIYCLALGNIYSDPNYNNLNHWAILQTLSRKGIYVAEPSDGGQLTETTLIQTNPLRMNAHMAVIEAIMSLYAKEVVTTERVLAAINRFSHERVDLPRVPDTHEECMLVWVRHTCDALKKRIDQELQCGASNGGEGDRLRSPELPAIKELPDLCDGVGLSALISYYCSEELPWKRIRVSYLPSVQDSLHNLGLVQDFCQRCLPASIFHMMPEDVTYMRGSMKQNLVVFLADLFNLLEINPAKCVRYAGMERPTPEVFPAYNAHGVAHKRNLPQTVMSPIPDLRSGLDDPANPSAFQVTRSTPTHTPIRKTNSMTSALTDMTEDSLRREEAFVVHRGRNIPTLSSVLQDDPNVRLRSAEKKAAQDAAAGKPSNWDENKKSTFAGRRSRRNSVTEDSQLTIENFGGSQDNLNFIGRNPDKEVGVHVTRKISAPAGPVENPAVRSSLKDAQGSFQLGYDNGCEKVDDEREKYRMKRQLSSDDIALRKSNDIDAKPNRTSFAEMHGKQKGIQLVYTEGSGESGVMNGKEKKTTTFAALPNTTTWQQQSSNLQQEEPTVTSTEEGGNNVHMASQLNDIRLKLEEKRRHIENEKRKMELAMNKQRQKVGKAAFLQAVVKGKGSLLKTQESDAKEETDGTASQTSKPKRPVSLKEISDDVTTVEKKWFDDGQMFVETRRTPDFENMDLEQYQQSIAQMNSSLHDIQTDIQRLASQQNQIQMAQQHELVAQRQKWLQFEAMQQQQQQLQSMQPPQTSFVPHTNYSSQMYPRQAPSYNPLQSSASAPHIPQSLYGQHQQPQNQFFLHDQQPTPPQRRTWAQQAQLQSSPDPYQHHPQPQPELRTWAKPLNPSGFVLHDASDRYHQEPKHQDTMPHTRYQNGGDYGDHRNTFTLSQQHAQQQQQSYSTPSASPQHVRTSSIHRQISQLLDDVRASPVSLQQMEAIARKTNVTHAPIPAPPADDMEPQNISFIGSNSADKLAEGVSRLNITSGTRTYRIPSPTRPLLSRTQFQQAEKVAENEQIGGEVSSLDGDANGQKGFYISFDNEQPKRPKPPLRMKRASPKKERSQTDLKEEVNNYLEIERLGRVKMLEKELEEVKQKQEEEEKRKRDSERRERYIRETSQENERQKVAAASAIIIGNDLSNPDPDLMDERERKKEKILMMSLQRRQRQEELKERKEQEAQLRREREKEKEEERARKKEEQAARRAAILEQYKLKKAIEEAEREGKTLDKPELLSSLKPVPKLRTKATMARPRPKTIHIDSGSVEIAEGMMQPARGKKGSSSNLTANSNYSQPSTMRRDYYRGSQDSLADRGIGLYKDSPDDSRGMSPCHSANQTLGRRSSYKTSREPSPAQVRGRPKYSTYQNFKGRKSNSMMNLYGSSIDQDSMAYRYGDTDSGLGRATPPRRAPSPGMGGGGGGGSGLRHLPSPSGPGSLPGFMSKRRVFDDGSSDISSTPSSMLDYSGPRLYKQPATKSNRGIMLNAVEYCVFPGAVNKEAKRRVLEEIARSESKHFLILFRDAGCQFRALYSYCPDREEVCKLYGTGPKQVNDRMFDKFFKYNSGGKCFSQVHTKHLTVTIDAFTIHNSLWQGKKVNLPNKKDMALVI